MRPAGTRAMVLWINGPFGVGKTTTAHALRAGLRAQGCRAHIYDPEIVGIALQRLAPARWRPDDFRDVGLWRAATRLAVASPHLGLRIVPMTVHEPALLRRLLPPRAVVCQLVAPRDVVAARLRDRGAGDWAHRQLARWSYAPGLGTAVDATQPVEAVVRELWGRIA